MKNSEIKTTTDIAREGKFDPYMMKYFTKEEIVMLKENADKETRKKIEEFEKIDIDEIEMAFKNLQNVIENDDHSKHDEYYGNSEIEFRKFEFWLALRQIPINIAKLYMYMGDMAFKNSRFRSYIHIDDQKLEQDFKSYFDFYNNPKKYTL